MKLSRIYKGCKKGGRPSLAKDWYIDCEINGKRRQVKGAINTAKTLHEREAAARKLKEEIDEEIIQRYADGKKGGIKYNKIKTLRECLDQSIADKSKIIAEGSIKEYTTPLKFFYEQTDILGLTDSDIKLITKPVFRDIIHKMVDVRAKAADAKGKKYSRAYNFRKYKANLLNLFKPWVEDEIIDKNPGEFTTPYKKPAPKLKIPLDQDQRNAIRKKITKELPCFFPLCMMVMHTSMRPVEILRLTVKDISLKRREVFVYGDIVKNRKGRIVKIPDVLVPYIQSIQLDLYPDRYYVFGQEFIPEEREKPMREDKANRPWKKMVKDPIEEGGLGIDSNLYHLKDLGMATKIDADIPVDAVQYLAGHASINQSMVYMQPAMKAEIKRKMAEAAKIKIASDMEKLMKNAADF
jgi:integrase